MSTIGGIFLRHGQWVAVLVSLLLSVLCYQNIAIYLWYDTPPDLAHTSLYALDLDFIARSPGMPILLEILHAIFPAESRLPALVLIQHGLVAIEVLLIFAILRPLAPRWIALLGAFAWALRIRNHLIAQTTQTESIFIFLVILAVFLFSWAHQKFRNESPSAIAGFLAAGGTIGLALGMRSPGIALIACSLFLLLLPLRSSGSWTNRLSLTALPLLGGFLIATAGFFAWNRIQHQRLVLTEELGVHLYGRMITSVRELGDSKEADQIREACAATKTDPLLDHYAVRTVLTQHFKISMGESDEIQKVAALESFGDHPGKYFAGVIEGLFLCSRSQYTREDVVPKGLTTAEWQEHEKWFGELGAAWPEGAEVVNLFPRPDPPDSQSEGLLQFIQIFGDSKLGNFWRGPWVPMALPILFFWGVFRRDLPMAFCAGSAFGILVLGAATEAPLTRFWTPAIPLLLISFCLGVARFFPTTSRRNP